MGILYVNTNLDKRKLEVHYIVELIVTPIRSAKVQINRNVCCRRQSPFYSLKRSDACMCQYYIQTLVQIIARRLFCAKPLSEPMLQYCQLDYKKHIQ